MKAKTPQYQILPFQFMRMPQGKVILVNIAGEFIVLKSHTFENLIADKMGTGSNVFLDLKGKHFVTDTELSPVVDLLATKYRTKKAFMKNFTSLHMVVVTLRCNQRCRYCHASSEAPDRTEWDMNHSTAQKVVEMAFMSPSAHIKIEFQGGEPLLNWDVVKGIIEHAEALNKRSPKRLEFVLCTNLTLITPEILEYIKAHKVLISTSLDGPRDLHDKNRILRDGQGTYKVVLEKLHMAQDILGRDQISALMTTSKNILGRMKEVVDEYVGHGLSGVFFRALNPYGSAKVDDKLLGYEIERFVDAYKEALAYIISLNLNGLYFEESYATLLLRRILTPFSTGFVDLQSPAGVGISGVIYDYNGDVYPSDEARMQAKMGDKVFLLGNVNKDSYLDIFGGDALRRIIGKSIVETLPGCSSCAFRQYCGTDPIRNYAEQGDIVGHRPTNNFCKKNKGIFKYLFELITEGDEDVIDVFWSWITKRSLEETKVASSKGTAP